MNKKVLIIIFLIFVLIRISLFLFIPQIVIKINGDVNVILNYQEVYEEQGAKVYSCNILGCKLISKNTSHNTIKTNTIGKYTIKYEYTINSITYFKTRTVVVIDKEKPIITLIGDDKMYLNIGSEYKELGAQAEDDYDGDLNNYIQIRSNLNTNNTGTYTVTYRVKDSSENLSTISRTVIVYDEKQNIALKENNNEQIISAINDIESYIKTKKLSVSIIYYDILTGSTYTYNPNKVYYGCSLIKTLDAMYVYEKMALNDNLRSLVKKAIEVSDNDAHYTLVNKIGKSELKKYGEELGAKNVLTLSGIYGNTTVYDQLAYMKHLFKLINTLDNGNELKTFFLSDFKKYIKFDGSPEIMHKYGRISEAYFHESAIVLDERPYIVSILTQEDDRKNIITELSKKIYDLHLLIKEN